MNVHEVVLNLKKWLANEGLFIPVTAFVGSIEVLLVEENNELDLDGQGQ